MIENRLMLFSVFDYLRKRGVPLGISEYLLVFKLIQQGFNLASVKDFEQVCRLIWAKSKEEQKLFDYAFAFYVTSKLQFEKKQDNRETSDVDNLPVDSPPTSITSSPVEDQKHLEPAPQSQSADTNRQLEPILRFKPVAHQSESTPLYIGQMPSNRIRPSRHYTLIPELPINRRDMTYAWRNLRRMQREGPFQDLDVKGTIDKICKIGCFIEPVLQSRRRNRALLLILIDQSDSMAPFSLLVEALITSISRIGLSRISIRYFQNCPGRYLYEKPNLTGTVSLTEIFTEHAKGNSVLILSDAGAAHGFFSEFRLAATKDFITTLTEYTYLYTWLNPMPFNRWSETTAEMIAKLVPMFHLDRDGLNDIVNILRGHPFPPEISLYG